MSGNVQSDAVSFGPVPNQRPANPSSHQGQAASGSVVIHGSSHVHVGSNVTLGTTKVRRRRLPPPATPAMIALFRCRSAVTPEQVLTTSRYIGAAWQDMARRLGFLGAETDDFEYRADSLREICFRMLMAWRERESAAATVEALMKALWDVEAYDAVVKLAEASAS